MTNSFAAAMLAALPEGDGPLQRLKALVAKMGIGGTGAPSRKDRRAVLSLARRLGVGIDDPEPTGRERPPVLPLPPAAESVIRRREKAWRDLTRERFSQAVSRVQRSPLGRKVALQATDRSAGARALVVLGGLAVDPSQIDRDSLAWAGQLPPADVKYLFGPDAALLPDEAVIAGAFEPERRRTAVLLKSRVKRSALEGGTPTPLTAPVMGVDVDEATAKELLGEYTEAVAQRAAVKRGLLALLRQQAQGAFPPEPPHERWARLAWLTIVGHALPPFARRFAAQKELKTELATTGLTVSQLCASLYIARQEVSRKGPRHSA